MSNDDMQRRADEMSWLTESFKLFGGRFENEKKLIENWMLAHERERKLTTTTAAFATIPNALRGDDRPAPNGDAWETEMLNRLA